MLAQIKYLLGTENTQPVFVIGTGRSGTHWLGHSVANHPQIRATVEARPMFGLATKMALNPALEARLFPRLVWAYRWQLLRSAPRLYLDKTHPNIWLAEKLQRAFPRALFLGIERNVYGTVASMMKHSGVASWHRRWREFPTPNRFLGITAEESENYDDLPLATQCALRWLAHRNRMQTLRTTLGNDLLVISYEQFADDPAATTARLEQFLGLSVPLPIPEVKRESLHKWRSQLTSAEILQIQRRVGDTPGYELNLSKCA